MAEQAKFKRGIGRWAGTAEVYNGNGQFVGNALDRRNVEQISDSQIRINLNFVGPLMLSGHYIIESHEGYRLYRGPANVGYAEALGDGMVEAHNYWSHWGLSQRFFLYVTPDKTMQLSFALLSRGEQLQYMVVGEYYRLPDDDEGADSGEFIPVPESLLISGTPQDKQHDPSAGRGDILLHQASNWSGEVTVLDGQNRLVETSQFEQYIEADDNKVVLQVTGGGLVTSPYTVEFETNNWQAWTGSGDIVGSYNLAGGRALSGQIHHLNDERRVWIREVVSADGQTKAILHVAFRGGERVGTQYGLLRNS